VSTVRVTHINTEALELQKLYTRVAWRIVPLLFLCYILAYLNRVNIGFAKLQMQGELGFSDATYGLGAGIFFIGYFLFEVPSNLILERVGARRWIARIMITWGCLSAAMMFVTTPTTFYVLRFLLGVAEAGFFPGIILYLTYWFPVERRGRYMALFLTAIPLAGVIGSPISGAVMQLLAGHSGRSGWQWLFLMEGIPTLIMGIVVMCILDEGISSANWLNTAQKRVLIEQLQREMGSKTSHTFGEAIRNVRVWILGLVYFGIVMGLYGIGFWLPSLLKAAGVQSPIQIGWLSAVPYVVATLSMVWIGQRADARHERRWHTAVPAVVGGIGLIGSAFYGAELVPALIFLSIACIGIMGALSVFWGLPTTFLGGTAAAGGIALINSLGNLAGFVSPYLVGLVRDLTRSTTLGMHTLAICLIVSGILVVSAIPAALVNR